MKANIFGKEATIKVRKGDNRLVRTTIRHEDPRRKTRSQQKRAWKDEVADALS